MPSEARQLHLLKKVLIVKLIILPNMADTRFHTEIINLEPSLTRYAYSLTANMDDAKDLVQETYFKALTTRTNSTTRPTSKPGCTQL